ncbi:Two component transcriptional regulator, LuxR family (fragment) [Crenothrix polyspora]|uniref:Two component transcriptional regulator, LuxR family n=1 Tax=Crenothrix polyspora TaxID=360316 RepID=A0A1R4HBY2_9GAMM
MHRHPKCKILVFSIHNEMAYVTRAIKAGAKGYVNKNNSPEILITAVCTIAQGGTFVDPALVQGLAIVLTNSQDESDKVEQLSPREFDVFCLLASGYSTRKVAEKLCLSYKTVCNHTTFIKEKMGVETLAELTLIAGRQGIIDMQQ